MPDVINHWSPDYVHQLTHEATEIAKRDNLRPALVREVVMSYRQHGRFNIPLLGEHVPQGWKRVDWMIEPVYVATAGKALPGTGPVLNYDQFFRLAKQHMRTEDSMLIGYGVVEQGQFQVLIATYRRNL